MLEWDQQSLVREITATLNNKAAISKTNEIPYLITVSSKGKKF